MTTRVLRLRDVLWTTAGLVVVQWLVIPWMAGDYR